LTVYAEKRNSTPEKLALSFVSRHIPSPVETLTCCGCGKTFPNYKKKKFYCSDTCYKSAAFPRLGIGLGALQDYYGSSLPVASEALGVSLVQFRRVVKRFGLLNRFEVRNG